MRLSVFVTANIIVGTYYLNFGLMYSSPFLKSGMVPQKLTDFPILPKTFHDYVPLVPFQNKWPKYELNIWVGSFWAHVPSPTPLKSVRGGGGGGGGRIWASYDLNVVNANFESF